MPDDPPWELEYDALRQHLFARHRQPVPDEFAQLRGTEADAADSGQSGFAPAPRVTEADDAGDAKSLRRALDKRLFLLIRTPGVWKLLSPEDCGMLCWRQMWVEEGMCRQGCPSHHIANAASKAVNAASRCGWGKHMALPTGAAQGGGDDTADCGARSGRGIDRGPRQVPDSSMRFACLHAKVQEKVHWQMTRHVHWCPEPPMTT